MSDSKHGKYLLSPTKRALLRILRAEQGLTSASSRRIPLLEPGKPIPLTNGQEGLWFLSVMEAAGVAYSVPLVYRLRGDLRIEQLLRSLNYIILRHQILRTNFQQLDGQVVQVVSPQREIDLPVVDVSDRLADERELHITRLILEDVNAPFDLSDGPLLRGLLFRENEKSYVLYLNFHHIILDEWSLEKLILELELDYQAGVTGQSADLPQLPVQYKDFASWTRRLLDSGVYVDQLKFWKEKLKEADYFLSLPTDKPRPDALTFRGTTVKRGISVGLCDAINKHCQEQGVTSFVFFLSVYVILLSKYSRRSDILVGTPVANRAYFDVQNLIGYFLNTLVIRTDVGESLLFSELLQLVKRAFLEAMENQDLPFEQLVKELNPEREPGLHPLFQVMFVLQNYSAFKLELPDVQTELLSLDFGWSKFDLTLFVMEKIDGFEIKAEYRTDIFDQRTILRLLEHYVTLLTEAVENPRLEIRDFSMLAENEKATLRAWNNTRHSYPPVAGIHQLVESQVVKTPQAIAVEFAGQQMTYHELNRRANQLAAFLIQQGIGDNDIVGICLDRSMELMVSLLGVVKAGGGILPLDPHYPSKRLEMICQDAQVSLILAHSDLVPRLKSVVNGFPILNYETQQLSSFEEHNPQLPVDPENLLYVLYTSGSTGQPKGVMMPHRPLINLVNWQNSLDYFSQPSAGTLQFTSLNFDVSFQEIFATWCSGGRLVLVSEEIRTDLDRLLQYVIDHQIDRIYMPFVALQALAESAVKSSLYPHSLRDVITAGEQLRITPEIQAFFEHLDGCRLHNHYGPTEAHVVSAFSLEGKPDSWPRLPPIGKPVANTKIYILDQYLQPVPVGIPGEIYLAGKCLAQGYLNQSQLTEERFIYHSIDNQNLRLYRTGDLGRYQKDGEILYLGRVDQQVKVRGYRVEPGEIEAALGAIPQVRGAVVMPRKTPAGSTWLEAFIVPEMNAPISFEVVREELRTRLPDYMIPAKFTLREELPLTPSGKIDRRALERMTDGELPAESDRSFAPPRDELESRLCQIWEIILDTGKVGINDSFFDAGGHSLLAVRLMTEIESQLGVHLPVASLFQAPSVAHQAVLIRQKQIPSAIPPIIPLQVQGNLPPFFCIHNFGGFVFNYEPLSQALGNDQPFYGVQAYGLEGIDQPHTSIEDMSQYYAQAILEKQPQGPYYLGGYCFGGVVAYQVACLLSAMGKKTGLLALIDAYAPSHAQKNASGGWGRLAAIWKNLPFWLRDFHQLSPEERQVVLNRRFKRMMIAIKNRLGMSVQITARELIGDHAHVTSAPEHLQHLMELHMLALMNYSPPVYDGKVTLFRIQRLPLFTHYDPDLGWGQSALGGVEMHIIPGAHHNALMPPYVQGLADELKRSLERAHRQAA